MPRFTLHRSAPASSTGDDRATGADERAATPVPEGLASDARVRVLGALPSMLLIDCPEPVAQEWAAKMPGWELKPEMKVRLPDPRPKLGSR